MILTLVLSTVFDELGNYPTTQPNSTKPNPSMHVCTGFVTVTVAVLILYSRKYFLSSTNILFYVSCLSINVLLCATHVLLIYCTNLLPSPRVRRDPKFVILLHFLSCYKDNHLIYTA